MGVSNNFVGVISRKFCETIISELVMENFLFSLSEICESFVFADCFWLYFSNFATFCLGKILNDIFVICTKIRKFSNYSEISCISKCGPSNCLFCDILKSNFVTTVIVSM
jgi:hypothetical protein